MKKMCLAISNRCFMTCEGCIYNQNSNTSPTISTIQVLNFVQLLKDIGYKQVTLTGGDPLAREDIADLVRGIKVMDMNIHLDTTGYPLLQKGFQKIFPLK